MAGSHHHLMVNRILVAHSKICYDSRGEESVERVACQLVTAATGGGDGAPELLAADQPRETGRPGAAGRHPLAGAYLAPGRAGRRGRRSAPGEARRGGFPARSGAPGRGVQRQPTGLMVLSWRVVARMAVCACGRSPMAEQSPLTTCFRSPFDNTRKNTDTVARFTFRDYALGTSEHSLHYDLSSISLASSSHPMARKREI